MKINFERDLTGLQAGIDILSKELGFIVANDGITVKVEKRPGNIEVYSENNIVLIKYSEKIHFFRALGLFVEAASRNNSFHIVEEPQFSLNGVMFDVSRNAVLRVESIKLFLRKMALMGLNMMMLYTEDTYAIEGMPYFGYMRGRYSYDEIKECDDYAEIFGIEIIPCIQTLGHLAQALKWNYANEVKDTDDILLAGCEKTYKLIEEMIVSASSPVRSKRIHIGMDEAHNLGLGRYLNINGYQRRFDIMNGHLRKVAEIAAQNGLRPMIWSDMYFRLGSKKGEYYDPDSVIPEDIVRNASKDVQLVYWDYYHSDEEFYSKYIKKHREFGADPVFAGAVWTWATFGANYNLTFMNTHSALNACKKDGLKEVIVTIWGDNGAEGNCFSAMLGLQLYAEHSYAKEFDAEKLKSRFKFCTGADYESFFDLQYLDETPGTREGNPNNCNPSKFLLWQDVLIGLFDRHLHGLLLNEHYSQLKEKIRKHRMLSPEWDFVFEVPEKLCSVLSLKSEIGLRIKENYDIKNLDILKQIAEIQLPELAGRVDGLRTAHRKQWLKTYKPFGWEVMDIRYGGVLARIDTAIKRLSDYIDGSIERIEEVEEERLYFDGRKEISDEPLLSCGLYNMIATASPI